MMIIYRKRDRLIAGYVHPRKTVAMFDEAASVEMDNILQSELGGVATDYAVCECAGIPEGQVAVINEDGAANFIDNPRIVARERVRLSAMVKLEALGLTQDEIKALRT
tara:strand:- start:341 stop:664 length:324 start_codon:yes stop_codon:yes gene_type:complete